MRDVRPLSAEEFATALFAVERPVILTHTHPDGDTVGTAAALIEAFRSIGKDAAYASEEPLPARLAFLTEGMRRGLRRSPSIPPRRSSSARSRSRLKAERRSH